MAASVSGAKSRGATGGAGEQLLPRRRARHAEVDVLVGDRGSASSASSRDEAQLLGREAVVQAHHHAARRRHAQPRLGVRARVGAEEADPRARGEIEARQAVGELAVAERRERDARSPYSRSARRSGQPRSLTAPAGGPRSPSARAAAPRRGSRASRSPPASGRA